jgi:hypothetical protein
LKFVRYSSAFSHESTSSFMSCFSLAFTSSALIDNANLVWIQHEREADRWVRCSSFNHLWRGVLMKPTHRPHILWLARPVVGNCTFCSSPRAYDCVLIRPIQKFRSQITIPGKKKPLRNNTTPSVSRNSSDCSKISRIRQSHLM